MKTTRLSTATRRHALTAFVTLALTALPAASAFAQKKDDLRIGYQKSASLLTLQKTQGTLEKRLAPLGVSV